MTTPASIRFNNPGAQYPGPSSQAHGSDRYEVIGGGHKIAVFPDAESGAAAQFDLLSRKYADRPLNDLVREWSGGHSNDAYTAHLAKALGVAPDTVITRDMLANPQQGVAFAKAAAQWEAGQPYPMTDQQWASAHARVFGGDATQPSPVAGQVAAAPVTAQPAAETQPAAQPGAGMDMQEIIGNLFRQDPTKEEAARRKASPMPRLDDDDTAAQQAALRVPQGRRLDLGRLRAALQSRATARA